jgi:hypothetical protein
MVEIKTSGEQRLGGTGDALSGDYLLDKVLFDPVGTTAYGGSALNETGVVGNATTTLTAGYTFAATGTFTATSTNITNASTTVTVVSANTYTVSVTNGPVSTGWVLIPASALALDSINGTQDQDASGRMPKVFWKVSGRDCYNWNNVTYNNPAISNAIKFDTAGDNSAAQGEIFFNSSLSTSSGAVTGYQAYIMLQEDAGKFGDNSNYKTLIAVPVIVNDTSYQTFRFRASDSSTQQVYYRGLRAAALTFTNYEPTLVTERGSKVLSVGTSDASIKVAKRIGMPTFQFAYADTATASASADEYVMGVGESKVFGGVTVKVKAISADCGSCSVLGPGGVPACTVDAVSAVISPDNVASVAVSMPYKVASGMVLLDSEAMSGVAITVGGPAVNTVTAEALKDSNVDFNVDSVVVKEIGNKIVVAGMTAQDTMAAADQFIAGVKRQ